MTPSTNSALLISAIIGGASAISFSAWTNSFTLEDHTTTLPSGAWAYLAQSTAAAVSTGATLSASTDWVAGLAVYIPGSAASCTHAGITSAGALAIPNGTTGSYWLKNGSFGVPDCSTVQYWQPALGNFGVN